MEIEALGREELKELYETRMGADFPPSELRPFSNMDYLLGLGAYRCFALREGGNAAAYALFAVWGGAALLDYFAVDPSRRGRGLGSRFLTGLKDAGPEAPYFLIEAESVESAATPEQLEERKRRIRFYEHCGCRATGVYSRLFGVEYRILALPLTENAVPGDSAVRTALEGLYHLIVPQLVGDSPEAYQKVCRCFFRPDRPGV